MTSRRALNATDDWVVSFTSSTIDDVHSGFRYLDSAQLQEAGNGIEVLRRSLTTRSVISTTSSFADRFQEASTRPDLQIIQHIGEGLQGTIFEQVGSSIVLKKEKPQNALRQCNLRNEHRHHEAAFRAFEKYQDDRAVSCDITIPRPLGFIEAKSNDAWALLLPKLPSDCQSRTDIMQMDRVLPMPKVIRRALIETLYPFPGNLTDNEKRLLTQNTLDKTFDKHCLIRPYLGVLRKEYSQATFSLRNIVLGINDLRNLGTNLELLATALGRAYATLHWGASINGDDVEFVLGSSLAELPGRTPRYQQRKIGLYLLDFGQCDYVDMRERSALEVYQAFRGALVMGDNQCFVPHARHVPQLFKIFTDEYASAAKKIVAEEPWKQAKFDIDEFMGLYQEYVEDFIL